MGLAFPRRSDNWQAGLTRRPRSAGSRGAELRRLQNRARTTPQQRSHDYALNGNFCSQGAAQLITRPDALTLPLRVGRFGSVFTSRTRRKDFNVCSGHLLTLVCSRASYLHARLDLFTSTGGLPPHLQAGRRPTRWTLVENQLEPTPGCRCSLENFRDTKALLHRTHIEMLTIRYRSVVAAAQRGLRRRESRAGPFMAEYGWPLDNRGHRRLRAWCLSQQHASTSRCSSADCSGRCRRAVNTALSCSVSPPLLRGRLAVFHLAAAV